MVTGDHSLTAMAVAQCVGIIKEKDNRYLLEGSELDTLDEALLQEKISNVSVFSRATPEHKFRLVQLFQAQGEIVLVTGDGVNDAPALKLANIGASMGITGTDTAKDVSSIILLDDKFSSLELGIQESRKLFENLVKSIRFYLSCKLALVLLFFITILFGFQFPLAPIQVILLEMFMDLGASSTFIVELPERDIMSRPPKNPKENILNTRFNLSIIVAAISLWVVVLLCFFLGGADTNLSRAQTYAFCSWLFGHVLLAMNLRTNRIPIIQHGLIANRFLLLWILAIIIALILVMYIPFLASIMKLVPLGILDLLIILSICLGGTCWMELAKFCSQLCCSTF